MRKIWLALLFFAGGLAHEVRNPTSCLCVNATYVHGPRKRKQG